MLESSIPEGPFVNNVYRRSLALAPPRRFPGVQLNSFPTYGRALLSERLEQAIGHAAVAYVASVSARVRHNFRAITRLETLATQADAAEDQNQILTSSWQINHPGSVHTKFYSRD